MSESDPLLRLHHMLDHAREAVRLIRGKSPEDLKADRVLMLALTHLVEIVGEAASQVDSETRTANDHIPWRHIVGMRNRLIHGYGFVDYDRLIETVTEDLPTLITDLEAIIGDQEPPCDPKP